MAEDFGYKEKADNPAESCSKCKAFKPKDDPSKGDCYGHEVSAEATCKKFQAKEE